MDSDLVEIAVSFAFKLNVGNYESRDFFCSQKAECKPEEAEAKADQLRQFCKNEVLKSINDWQAQENKIQASRPSTTKR